MQYIVQVICSAAEGVAHAGVFVVDVTARFAKETDGARVITNLALNCFRVHEMRTGSMDPFGGTATVLKPINDFLGCKNWIVRLNELTSGQAGRTNSVDGFPNFTRIASRVSLLVSDVLSFAKGLESLAVIAAGTANTVVLQVLGVTAIVASNYFGIVGVALELADNINSLPIKGFSVDLGLKISGNIARMISYGAYGTPLGIGAGIASGIIFIVRFIITPPPTAKPAAAAGAA